MIWTARYCAAFAVVAAGMGLLWGGSVSSQRSSLAPPVSVTPELIAMRGCIEGVSHPSEVALTFAEQLEACSDYLAHDRDVALHFRARLLVEDGWSDDHHRLAYRDLTQIIDEDPSAWAYAARGQLGAMHTDTLEAALSDMGEAIALSAENPRPAHFLSRALIFMAMAERDEDAARVHAAMDDIAVVLMLDPDNAAVPRMRDWNTAFLRNLRLREGDVVIPG